MLELVCPLLEAQRRTTGSWSSIHHSLFLFVGILTDFFLSLLGLWKASSHFLSHRFPRLRWEGYLYTSQINADSTCSVKWRPTPLPAPPPPHPPAAHPQFSPTHKKRTPPNPTNKASLSISKKKKTPPPPPQKPSTQKFLWPEVWLLNDSQAQPIKFSHNLCSICIEKKSLSLAVDIRAALPSRRIERIWRKCRHVFAKTH